LYFWAGETPTPQPENLINFCVEQAGCLFFKIVFLSWFEPTLAISQGLKPLAASPALPQSYKLFSSRWVNANSRVEVFLRSSHINSDRHSLNNLARVFPNHVHAQNSVSISFNN
jgi:hypothetical protein